MPADQDTPPSYAPAMVSKETTAEAPKESVSTPVETAGPTPPPKEAPAAPPKDDNAPATPPKDTVVASPATATETPISKLSARLPSITKSVDYSEMWGVQLGNPDSHVPTKVVLQKFLRANNGDVAAAEKQLTAALEWRKKMDPTALAAASYDEAKFGGLGYVTVHKDEASKETVMTWNIYGAVKSFKETFGDIDGFIKWRTALMELGVQKLNLSSVTEPIPEDGQDPYQMIQVHDYLSVSFLIPDSHVKAASSKTIELFSTSYPELLSNKYFVNVPTIMGWMFAAMKRIIAPATLQKLHLISYGTSLANELPTISASLPKEYGGKGVSVKDQGVAVKLDGAQDDAPKEAPVAAAAFTELKAEEAKPVEERTTQTVSNAETKGPEANKPAATTTEYTKADAVAETLAETKLEEKPAEIKAA